MRGRCRPDYFCWWYKLKKRRRKETDPNGNHGSHSAPQRRPWFTMSAFLIPLLLVLHTCQLVQACQISEYYCDNRKCVSLDKFCNGVDDCGDGSDEPRHCSPCNRTYYGEVGGTYTIAVHRPSSRESSFPYICQLTFAAGGSKFGDLVQLIFNSVTLGPSSDQDTYSSSSSSSEKGSPICREGHVTLNEPDRPATAGHWCGHDRTGQAVYFSETSRVTLTLSLNSLQSSSSPGAFAFDFRLTFKFLRKSDSTVRYGPPSAPFYRGELLPGTFCSLIFNTTCDKQKCALQSPNFPGIYPRDIHCFYAIRQLNAPVGHRAVIQLGQDKGHMVFVRNRQKSSYLRGSDPMGGGSGRGGRLGLGGGSSPFGGGSGGDLMMSTMGKNKLSNFDMGGGGGSEDLSIGDECDNTSDHVTIYDGYTIRDPVLLKFCGGGKFPPITSSGNELLMEFYSAPTDYLLQNRGFTAIQGFHVDVSIKHLPLGSHTYVENHNCLFTVSSFQQKRGFLTSPQHSLPSGTTCVYLLEGSPGEIVWISLLKFYIGKEFGGRAGSESYSVSGLTGSGAFSSSSSVGQSYSQNSPTSSSSRSTFTSIECNTTYFQIWQGTYSEKHNTNASLLAHLCEDTPIKRTCEFMLASTSSSKPPPRACRPDESFISKGPTMSLKLKIETTTVLRPAEFKLYYEFVDTRQDGDPFFFHHPLGGKPKASSIVSSSSAEMTKQKQLSPSSNNNVKVGNLGPVSDMGSGVLMSSGQSGGVLLPKDAAFKSESSGEREKEPGKKFSVENCSRIFKSQNRALQAGSFTSPRNVFYFGRGGVTNLTCIYRFQGGRHERVKVTFNKISLAGGFCKAEIDIFSGRSMCREPGRDDTSSSSTKVTKGRLQLWEVPWGANDSRILKECLCDAEHGPLSFVSVTSTLDIVLSVQNMQPFHDQDHFTFEGRYEFIKHPDCSRQQRVKGPSGSFTLTLPEKVPHQSCTFHPWEIQPQSSSHYIYLTIPGRTMKKFPSLPSSSKQQSGSSGPPITSLCDTRNRILVYSGGFEGRLLQIICPDEDAKSHVEIYSTRWENPYDFPNFAEHPDLSLSRLSSANGLIVELVSKGTGSNAAYDIRYMQISRRDEPLEWNLVGSSPLGATISGSSIVTLVSGGSPGDGKTVGSSAHGATSSASVITTDDVEDDVCFKFKCPELNACISPSLFCDGVSHCPSGHDEAECMYFPIPKPYLVLAAASLATFAVLTCCFGCLVCKKRRAERREKLLTLSSRTPTEEMFLGGVGSGGGGHGGSVSGIHYPPPPHHHHHHHYPHSSREIVC